MTQTTILPDLDELNYRGMILNEVRLVRDGETHFSLTPYVRPWQFYLNWGEVHDRFVWLVRRWIARIAAEDDDMAELMVNNLTWVLKQWFKLTLWGSAVTCNWHSFYSQLDRDVNNLLDCMERALKFGESRLNREYLIKQVKSWCNSIDAEFYLLSVRKLTVVGTESALLLTGDDVALALIDAALRAQSGEYVEHDIRDDLKAFVVGLPKHHVLAPCEREGSIYHFPVPFKLAVEIAKKRLS